MGNTKNKSIRKRNNRKRVQAGFMILYIISMGANMFFFLDPLAAITSSLAARAFIPSMIMASLTIIATLIWGRVWCGWVCPLGTLLDWIRFPGAKDRGAEIPSKWRAVKYILLITVLAAALVGNLTLMVLDPITILTQTLTTGILPVLNQVVVRIGELFSQPTEIAPIQFIFSTNVVFLGLFIGIVSLNALADRFWCRYICPLGGLLALISKLSFYRHVVKKECNHCGECVGSCPMGILKPELGYQADFSECIVCMDCLAACRSNAMNFRYAWEPSWGDVDLSRRQALTSLAGGIGGAILLQTGTKVAALGPDASCFLRPPGVTDEASFLSRCIRCGECLKACPTSALQPAQFDMGIEDIGSPVMRMRTGYCAYDCNKCGDVCPTEAIPPLDLAIKQQTVIGTAIIDRDRCLPWATGSPCTICLDVCPLEKKAIRFEEVQSTNSSGRTISRPVPFVENDYCVGCGACEYFCPVSGEAAIRIQRSSINE